MGKLPSETIGELGAFLLIAPMIAGLLCLGWMFVKHVLSDMPFLVALGVVSFILGFFLCCLAIFLETLDE